MSTEKSKTSLNWLHYLIITLVILFIGFMLGRWSTPVKIESDIQYLPGDTIYDEVPVYVDNIIKESEPCDTVELLKYCIDSGLYDYLIPEKVRDSLVYVQADSTKIIKDWLTRRDYQIELFNNDTIGKMIVRPSIQYNQLQVIPYEFTPIQKNITTTITKTRKIEPFIGVGLNTTQQLGVMGGVFLNNGWGAAYQYQYGLDTKFNSHGIYVIKKF